MNTYKTLIMISTLVLALSGAAQASELFTPALPALESNFLQCTVVNVTTETRTVRVQVFDSLGGEIADSLDVALGAGEGFGLSIPPSAAFYCKFTVEGAAKGFRASIAVFQPGVGLISALPAE